MSDKAKDANKTEGPWYKDGLKFKCSGCGDCCTGAPGYVWVNKAEIEALARRIDVSVDDFIRDYTRKVGIRYTLKEFGNGDCVFFDNRSRHCEVYEDRPRQCRTWPFWKSNLSSPKAWEQTCEECPGSGTGRLFTLEEIERSAAEIRV